MIVGVLALQGDFREHILALESIGAKTMLVKKPEELEDVRALVIPGGESTTISKLARAFGLFEPIVDRIAAGMPVYGSCAGMILLSDRVEDAAPGQKTFGGIDMTVRRNAFGRQVESFERSLRVLGVNGANMTGIFNRAPWDEEVGQTLELLASVEFHGKLHPVAVRQGALLATSFHPEITGDNRIHQLFLESI